MRTTPLTVVLDRRVMRDGTLTYCRLSLGEAVLFAPLRPTTPHHGTAEFPTADEVALARGVALEGWSAGPLLDCLLDSRLESVRSPAAAMLEAFEALEAAALPATDPEIDLGVTA